MIYPVIICVCLMALMAQWRKRSFWVVMIIVVLSTFVGLRSREVGVDTHVYYDIFLNVTRGIYSPNVEKEFLIVGAFFLKFMSVEYLFLLFAFITNTLIVLRLWDMREEHSFALLCILYVLLFYPETGNIMRQYLAVGFVFYGTRYLEKKKPVLFLIGVLVGAMFHRSALLAVLYIPLYFMCLNPSRETVKNWTILIAASIPIVVLAAIYKRNYLAALAANFSLGFLYPLEFVLVVIFLLTKYGRVLNVSEKKEEATSFPAMFITGAYIIGIFFGAMGYFQSSLYRMGLYFIMYKPAFISEIWKKGENRYFYVGLYGLFLAFSVYSMIRSGWSGLAFYSTWLR